MITGLLLVVPLLELSPQHLQSLYLVLEFNICLCLDQQLHHLRVTVLGCKVDCCLAPLFMGGTQETEDEIPAHSA